jgi:hypothetical protein
MNIETFESFNNRLNKAHEEIQKLYNSNETQDLPIKIGNFLSRFYPLYRELKYVESDNILYYKKDYIYLSCIYLLNGVFAQEDCDIYEDVCYCSYKAGFTQGRYTQEYTEYDECGYIK